MSAPHDVAYTIHISLGEAPASDAPGGLVWTSRLELKYAECFSVDYYEGGYALIDVRDSARYLVVPENAPVPEGLEDGIVVLQQPLDRIYLAATSAMALFDALDALDAIRLVGTDRNGWSIDHAVEAMDAGAILFAGKYSEPDYELLVSEGCDLAIESTMILHSPEVKELIELLGIPVLIDRSSYESHPLGRTEWIKLYAVLVGREAEAEAFFDAQAAVIDELAGFENTEKTVAFFYIGTDGSVVVRSAGDYIARMIEIAGGRYALAGLSDPDSARSSVSVTMEDFYAAAVNADYLIYNAAIDGSVGSVEELLAKSPLFADFKAVKEGNVWCTGKQLYQATDIVGSFITDLHNMLTGREDGMTFLYKLD
ncbi:MAG TPA: ABC transporter substrate-binding protein [Candidatus Faecivicinus avistercoris]|nr:ABC transporter substrate-binding protein [Candidatus Faecivicinus avistercoris]